MVAFWKECKMTKQTFDDLINQINTVSKDVQRERGTLFEKLTLAYLKMNQLTKPCIKMYGYCQKFLNLMVFPKKIQVLT